MYESCDLLISRYQKFISHMHCRTAIAELRRGSNGSGINISASVSEYLGWFVPEYVTSSRVQSPQHSGARKHVSVFQGRSRRNSSKEMSMPPLTTSVLTRTPLKLHTGRVMDAPETSIGPRESLWTQSGQEGETREGRETLTSIKSDTSMVPSKVVESIDRRSQSKCDGSSHDQTCVMAGHRDPSGLGSRAS
jgi:hypothetical protein